MIPFLGTDILLAVNDTLLYRQANANMASQLIGLYNVDEGLLSDDSSMLGNMQDDERYNRNLVPDALGLSYDIYRVSDKSEQAYHTKSFSDSKNGWIWLNDYIKHPDGYPFVSEEMKTFFQQIENLNYVDITGSGLVSGVFFQLVKKKKIRIAYVTKGTSSLKDWIANGSQGWDGNSRLYEDACKIARKINYFKSKTSIISCLYFFGHSLGGGMANYNAMTTGNPSVTFNAASVHPNSVMRNMRNYQLLVKNKLMIGVYVKGEALSTAISNIVGLPKNGNRYEIVINQEYFTNGDSAIERHSLEPMCSQYGLSSFNWNNRTII